MISFSLMGKPVPRRKEEKSAARAAPCKNKGVTRVLHQLVPQQKTRGTLCS